MKTFINWKNVPFVRIILPMITGILLAIYNDFTHSFWTLSFVISLLALSVSLFLTKRKPSLNKELFFGAIFYFTIFLAGVNIVIFNTAKNDTLHYQKHNQNSVKYIVEVVDLPKEKENSIQIVATIESCIDSNQNQVTTNGKALLYFAKDSASSSLIQGDKLIIKSNLATISPPINPGQFNYQQYLSFNQIYQQGFVQHGDFLKIENGKFGLIKFASQCRDQLLLILKQNGLSGNELAVASALILGYKDDLGEELKHSYSSAGATHVLAVSGLHVGIIFLVLNFILNLFDKKDKFKLSKAIILILALWSYATITGLSPSVVRAATMFSFVTAGGAFQRKASIYNTLAASAFVLLCINPYLIMEVGFQLSYLAVLGIVYFQNLIYKRIYVKNKYLNYIWMITSVSIAAQLTTFPLGLLYFHQFPTYFFISNLVVIPAAMLIIGMGILLFILGWIPFVGSGIGWCLSTFIMGVNSFIIYIDKLPYSLIEGISISIFESWLIYLIILLFVLSYETRKMKYLVLSLATIIAFISNDIGEDYQLKDHKEITIYQIKGEPNIDFISQENHYFIADSTLINNRSAMLFNVHHHWFDLDLKPPKTHPIHATFETPNLLANSGVYQFYNTKIYHITESKSHYFKGEIDILYLDVKDQINISPIIENLKPTYIIVGNQCNYKLRTELKNLVSMKGANGCTIHFLRDSGAFTLNI